MSDKTFYIGIQYNKDENESVRDGSAHHSSAVFLEVNRQVVEQLDRIREILKVDALTDHCITDAELGAGLRIRLTDKVTEEQLDLLRAEADMNASLTFSSDKETVLPVDDIDRKIALTKVRSVES